METAKPPVAEFKAPLYVAWELTHRCNARCLHCYSASGPDAATDELTLDDGLELIDQLAEAGVLVLAFSGGEPLMHRHWEDLVGHAVRRGLSVNVGSNGSCINDRNADTLRKLGGQERHDQPRQPHGGGPRPFPAARWML